MLEVSSFPQTRVFTFVASDSYSLCTNYKAQSSTRYTLEPLQKIRKEESESAIWDRSSLFGIGGGVFDPQVGKTDLILQLAAGAGK
jgi:hypothetical protein